HFGPQQNCVSVMPQPLLMSFRMMLSPTAAVAKLESSPTASQIRCMVDIDMDAIMRLSVPERVRLVQAIWDTLQPTAEDLPLTEEQREILDQRLAEHRNNPHAAVPWDEVKARLESE
ncbi:MAG: addiction module protein, partial [Gemmatimonadetes bacterium]|nr:addiction module protein [Gemmatimonadota bacterium]